MAEVQTPEATTRIIPNNKRKMKHKKGKRPSKKTTASAIVAATGIKRKKPSKKMLEIFRKRAKNYHSDDDEEEEGKGEGGEEMAIKDRCTHGAFSTSSSKEEAHEGLEGNDSEGEDEDEGAEEHRGITKFTDGSRAFRAAFLKIMSIKLPNDPLGPILSAHKKLVAEKLAEEVEDHKSKGEAKKEKHLAAQKGHKTPANFLDAKEKFLINVATKGVVKLFNAVSKAQNPQTGLNPSKSKDAKALARQRKQAFLSELQRPSTQSRDVNLSKLPNSGDREEQNNPGWAPLQDSYMLGSKLKDWDKMPVPAAVADDDQGASSTASSSDEE